MDEIIIHAGQVAGGAVAILTLLGMIVKYGVLRPIKNYIDQATYPIQPGANGGLSLPDVAKAVGELRQQLADHLDRCK